MATIHISRVVPVANEVRFKGVLEAAYVIRFYLQLKSNTEIRAEMARLFGSHWSRPHQERRYFSLLRTYVGWHHEADYVRYLLKEDIRLKKQDKKTLRHTLVRYLITEQGMHGGSEVVNDIS